MKASSQRGSAVKWTVSAWALGGSVPDAVIRLRSVPASAGIPRFSFGCGNDGTSACDLGAVDPSSAPRQLQALVTVPAKASTVTSVSLTVTGSAAAHLIQPPTATAAVTITAPPAGPPSPTRTLEPGTSSSPTHSGGSGGSGSGQGGSGNSGSGQLGSGGSGSGQGSSGGSGTGSSGPGGSHPERSLGGGSGAGGSQGSGSARGQEPGAGATGAPLSTPLPAGTLPELPTASASPSGNAANLFPTLHPQPAPSAPKARARPVANTSALPGGAPVVGAQLAGLAALALALALAVTRLSVRRRSAPVKPPADAATRGTPDTGTPGDSPSDQVS